MTDPTREAPARRLRVEVIVPALDEEQSIARVLDEIPRDLCDDVIVVDNGSTDRTAEVAAAHGARVVREPKRGYGAACLAGMAALGPADVVVFLDADYSDHPGEMRSLVEPIAGDRADLVIGSRMLAGDSRRALLPQARFGNWLAGRLLSFFFGARVTDLGPFRAIRREALDLLGMDDRDYGWTVQMQARALARGLRVIEVPVSYRTRIGYSKISGTAKGTILAGQKILRTIAVEAWRARTGRARRPEA